MVQLVPKDVTKCGKIETRVRTHCQKEGPCLSTVPCRGVWLPLLLWPPISSGGKRRLRPRERGSGKASLIAKSRAGSFLSAVLLCACPSKGPGRGHTPGFAGAWGWRSPPPWSLSLACSHRRHMAHPWPPTHGSSEPVHSRPASRLSLA